MDMVKLNKFHRKNIERMLKKVNCPIDIIDINAIWDSSLSAEENFNRIKEELKKLGYVNVEDYYQKDEKEYLEHKMTLEEEKHYRKEFEKRISQIKKSNIRELSEYYKNYYEHIESFLKNKKTNGFICVGEAGIGKSFNLMLKLKEKQLDFKLIKGHFTPLAFYKFLYENREKSYIIIDDITKLANDKDIISLLLGALDYDNRLVEWESSRPLTADLPRNFIFNSKIFILANQFDETNEFLKALKDRCVYYELRFSREQIIEMLYILAKKRNYPLELVDYIKELSENEIIKNLSLRILDKIYPYYSRPNWKELVREIMETDEMLSLVYQIIKETKIVKEQVRRFIEETGMSRRTFFRYKKKLKLALRGLK